MDCSEFILKEDTVELVRALDEGAFFGKPPLCSQDVGWGYSVEYYSADDVPPLSLRSYTYSSIPKCYAPQAQSVINLSALEDSGISALQNLSTLDLRGRGVLVAVIDSGIRYQDAAFRDEYGRTRIAAMWDQTVIGADDILTDRQEGMADGQEGVAERQDDMMHDGSSDTSESEARGDRTDDRTFHTAAGMPPEGVLYGREYNRNEIGEALNGIGVVAETDETGHGTAVAGIAAGSADAITGFSGAAPEAELLVVKLRQAKPYLRDFFCVPDGVVAYSEADILAALHYVNRKALELGRPLVICMSLGSSSGGRIGTGVLDDCINQIAALRNRAVVCAVGNMANARRHFSGHTDSVISPVRVELNVEEDADGLTAELWALSPERFSVEVASPTGQQLSRVVSPGEWNQEADFIFEGTHLEVSCRDVYRFGQNLLIFFRFTNIVRGIWTIRVYPDMAINGNFNMWLPMEELSSTPVTFLEPSPETTLLTPSDSYVPISVGGYDSETGAMYLDSGRGYNANGGVRPDFAAPAVKLTTRGLRDNYVTMTGTSGAAAITAGACALFMEWAVTRGYMSNINSVDLKNLLIRGCDRETDRIYPSPETGYGKLDAYHALENLR